MDLLRVSAIGSAHLSALKPPPPPAPPTVQPSAGLASPQDGVQGLAQELFRQSLQTAASFPVAEPVGGSLGLAQTATASLLAALNAPQAAAATTATPNATTAPAAILASGTTAPTTAATPAVPGDLPALQDAFQTSTSQEFALQTALRFGAGVLAQAAPASEPANLGAGLIRDAAAVPRLENLQPRAGGPGPEAFAQPQGPVQQALRTYPVPPIAEGPSRLDLLA